MPTPRPAARARTKRPSAHLRPGTMQSRQRRRSNPPCSCALVGCSPTAAMKPCRSFAIRCDWSSPSSGSALLMLVFGFGITTDVEHIRYATFDLDQSAESRAYLEQFAGTPRYFSQTAPVRSAEDALERLQSDDISLVLEIPPNFGRDLRRGSRPEVLAQVDGANTFRGETVAQYVQGVQNTMLRDPASGLQTRPSKYTATFPRSLHVQSDVRKRLLDRSERPAPAADPHSGDPHGDQHRAREGAGLDHQLLCHADRAARISAGKADPLHRDRHAQLFHSWSPWRLSSSASRSREAF